MEIKLKRITKPQLIQLMSDNGLDSAGVSKQQMWDQLQQKVDADSLRDQVQQIAPAALPAVEQQAPPELQQPEPEQPEPQDEDDGGQEQLPEIVDQPLESSPVVPQDAEQRFDAGAYEVDLLQLLQDAIAAPADVAEIYTPERLQALLTDWPKFKTAIAAPTKRAKQPRQKADPTQKLQRAEKCYNAVKTACGGDFRQAKGSHYQSAAATIGGSVTLTRANARAYEAYLTIKPIRDAYDGKQLTWSELYDIGFRNKLNKLGPEQLATEVEQMLADAA